jgi:hypothetical protein
MDQSRRWSVPAFLVVAASLAGCSESLKTPSVAPAAGVATYNGNPVEGATVVLMSEATKKEGWSCSGTTNATGAFSITTIFAPGSEKKGIPPGDYTALVTKFEAPPAPPKDLKEYEAQQREKIKGGVPISNASTAPKVLVPLKYATDETSDLKVKIETAGNESIKLELKD